MTGQPPDQIAAEVGGIDAANCRSIAFSPDGSAFAVIGGGHLTFLEYPDREIWRVPCDPAADAAAPVVWGAAGDRLYVLNGGELAGYEFESGEPTALPADFGEYGALTALAVSPDRQLVTVGTEAGQVLVLAEGTERVLALRGTRPVTAIGWRPGGSELCVARADTLEFWDVQDRAMLTSMHVNAAPVRRLAWSSDGMQLAACGLAGLSVIRVGAPNDRAVTGEWADGVPAAVSFSRDGRLLLIGVHGGGVLAVRRGGLQPVTTIPADITQDGQLDLSPAGLLAVRADSRTIRFWELPDTAQSPGRAVTADRRWAARHGRSVGRRLPSRHGQAALARPDILPLSGTDPKSFAWWPDGRSACVTTGPRTVARIQPPASQPAWSWSADGDDRIAHVTIGPGDMVAATSGDQVTLLSGSGEPLAAFAGGGPAAWAPGDGAGLLAILELGPRPRQVLLCRPDQPDAEPQGLPMPDGVAGVDWSPDGRLLAAAGRGHVVLWDAQARRRVRNPLRAGKADVLTGPLAWSPDGRQLAAVCRGEYRTDITIWSTRTWDIVGYVPAVSRADGPAIAWSPDGHLLAFATPGVIDGNDNVDLWDSVTRQRLTTLNQPGTGWVRGLAWSPDGDALAVAAEAVTIWDIAGVAPAAVSGELPFDRDTLLRLAVSASSVCAAVPLSLLADLLMLLSDDPPGELRALAAHRGMALLRGLRWPTDARIGLVTLLAADLPRESPYVAPPDASPNDLSIALRRVLSGISCPPSPRVAPIIPLAAALDGINDRLVTFLELLGHEAVAAEPTLPVRLRHLQDQLTPLTISQRRLLGVRVPLVGEGRSEGGSGGYGRAGIARSGPLDALLLSQLALSPRAFAIRYSRDELLYRTRGGSPPPAPHAAVLILDDTAAAHGQVGVTLRLVAHLAATTLLRRGRRCAVVTLGAPVTDRTMAKPEDLIGIWAAGTDAPPDPEAAWQVAERVLRDLTGAGGEGRIALLTHVFAPALPSPGSVAVRVHYPGEPLVTDDPRSVVIPPEPSAAELLDAVGRAIS
jgi:WD40 repeat protein